MEKLSSDQALKTSVDTIVRIEGRNQAAIDAVTAKNILHEELGRFTDEQPVYFLDEETRDRLLAHARQDAAHAVLSIGTANRRLVALEKQISRLQYLVLALAALVVVSVLVS